MRHTRMITVVAIGIALALTLAPWRADAQVGVGYEEVAVSTAAVPITVTVYRPADGSTEANHCTIFVEDAAIRYRTDGTAPTATVGYPAGENATIPVAADAIRRFQAIRSGAVNASLQVACFSASPGVDLPIPVEAEVLSTVSSAVADELADFTITSEEANLLDGGGISWRSALITEVAAAAASATYTASFVLPAESTIIDVQVRNTALWDDGTAAALICGDTADPNGTYDAVDLLATDLLVGEALTFEHPGGTAGADLTAEVRDFYRAAGTTYSCVVTVTDGDGTAGRTHILIGYAVTDTPTAVTFVDP